MSTAGGGFGGLGPPGTTLYNQGRHGGSGIIVVRYQIGKLLRQTTGGNVSFYTDPGTGIQKTIHTFTSSGDLHR